MQQILTIGGVVLYIFLILLCVIYSVKLFFELTELGHGNFKRYGLSFIMFVSLMIILFSMPVIDLFLVIQPLFMDISFTYQILIALIPFLLFLIFSIVVWINNDSWIWSFVKKVSGIVFGTATIASISFFARVNVVDYPIVKIIAKPIIKIVVPEKFAFIEFISKLKITNTEEIKIVSKLFGKVDNEVIEKLVASGVILNEEGVKLVTKNISIDFSTFKLLVESHNIVSLAVLKNSFSNEQIVEWVSQISKKGDIKIVTKDIGQVISKLVATNKLPKEDVQSLLESTFLRMLEMQGKIKNPNEYYLSLSGVDGFQSTLSKIMGVNDNVTKGHLLTLDLAKAIKQNNGVVNKINAPFNDGIKSGISDVDLVITLKNKNFIAEVKNYYDVTLTSVNGTFIPDILTLQQYQKTNAPNCEMVFILLNKPSNESIKSFFEQYAQESGIRVLYGKPEDVITQLL